jgi:hypothetical protein
MIFDSHPWKESLLKRARELRRQSIQRRWGEASFGKLERNVLVGFYEIRKLIEARKLSPSTVESVHHVMRYPSLGKPVHRFNWDRYWDLYDLEHGTPQDLKLPFLCNQFVHSFVFSASFEEGGMLDGIVVSSDRERLGQAYCISLTEIISTFETVGSDYPSSLGPMLFDEKTQNYKFE